MPDENAPVSEITTTECHEGLEKAVQSLEDTFSELSNSTIRKRLKRHAPKIDLHFVVTASK